MRAIAEALPAPDAMLDVADRTLRAESQEMYATALAGILDLKRHEFTFDALLEVTRDMKLGPVAFAPP